MRQAEPGALLFEVRTMADIAAAAAAVSRLAMRLLAGFALVALALAAVGIYSVLSYSVGRRRREMGTRLALGASRRDVIGLVLRQGAGIAAVGLTVGIAAGLAAARSLSSLLYDVPPWDPLGARRRGAGPGRHRSGGQLSAGPPRRTRRSRGHPHR